MILNILIPILLALATNGLIFALDWNQPDHDIQPAWAPPGYAVGIVWTVLFGLMGAARWQTAKARDDKGKQLITALIALCLAYPFYTLGFQDRMIGLIGIVVTGAFTIYIVWRCWRRTRNTSLLLLPLLGWLCFATLLIMAVSRLNA